MDNKKPHDSTNSRISSGTSMTDSEGNLIGISPKVFFFPKVGSTFFFFQGQNGEILCDRCGEVAATLDCVECKVCFCRECASEIHQKGKWKAHSLKPLNQNATKMPQNGSPPPSPATNELANDKREWFRSNVINEIISTEAEYLKDLNIMGKVN